MPDAATAASADPPSEATALPLSSGSGYDHPDLSPDEFQPEDSPAVLSTIPSNLHSSGPERGWKSSDCCRKENSPSHITGYPARQKDHNPVKPMVGSKKRHIGLRKVQHNAPLSKNTPPVQTLVKKLAPVSKPVLNERQEERVLQERVLIPQTDFAKRFLLSRRQL